MNWNFSEAIYQLGGSDIAERPALIHDDEIISFAELTQRACSMASWLSSFDLPSGSHIGHYMRNSNVYTETFIASGLAGMSHVNVNFRYLEDELLELCNGLDIRVLVYDREFAEIVARIRERLCKTIAFLEVGSGSSSNHFAVSITDAYAYNNAGFSRKTSSDDLILIATGGTTGLPKGTQWRQEDMWRKTAVSKGGAMAVLALEEHPTTMEEHVRNVASLPPARPLYPLWPLMHGTGLRVAIMALAQGTAVVTSSGNGFDPSKAVNMIVEHGVAGLVLVGDAFARHGNFAGSDFFWFYSQ
jgi:fatty-acyl-CoA synthase